MDTSCRVEVETEEYLIAEEIRERKAEMFADLDVKNCDICDQQAPATEFYYDGICETCANDKDAIIDSGIVDDDHEAALSINEAITISQAA